MSAQELLQEYIWIIKSHRKYQYWEAWGRETQFPLNYLQQQFRSLNAQLEEKGINIDGEKLLDLWFADDVALTTKGAKDIEHLLNSMNKENFKIGIRIHKVYNK